MLNQQIQRHPLKPTEVCNHAEAYMIMHFSTHKLPEKIDYGDDVCI